MQNDSILDLLEHQMVYLDTLDDIKKILNKESLLLSMVNAVNYGIILGKRMERSKKHKEAKTA